MFTDVKMRYRPNTPLILRGINCTIQGGHKIGCVGRTGAGKSSLLVALFRLVEIEKEGSITIDGVDINEVGLQTLVSTLNLSVFKCVHARFLSAKQSGGDPAGSNALQRQSEAEFGPVW